MTLEQVLKNFGGQAETARILGVSRQAIHLWSKRGIPKLREYQIEKLTKGKLKLSKGSLVG